MIAVEYEEGKVIVDTCTCECGASLTLPWGGSYGINSYVLKCARDPSHDKVVPVKSFYQMWREGKELPCFIKDNIEGKLREEIMEQNNVKALVIKKDADKLSTYLQAKFPQDLARLDVALDFARWCIAHQLEPIRDCVPFQGNPYICVEWLDRQASDDDKFKGYSYRVFSKQNKEALEFDPKDLVVECQADWEGLKKPLIGLGVVTIKEREAKTGREIDEHTARGYRSPVVRLKPQQMVFKRARAAVLKQRYHIPAPILEELPYTTTIEAKYTILDEKPAAAEPCGKTRAKVDEKLTKKKASGAERKFGAQRERGGGEEKADAANFREEVTSPDTARASAEPEGFGIDLASLRDILSDLKWNDITCKTFLVSQYKVSPTGTLEEVISRLTRVQAEEFVNEIQSRQSSKPRHLL